MLVDPLYAASMGPPISIDGNDDVPRHALELRVASMGPPISIDGNAGADDAGSHGGPASMGPPISIDGNLLSARRALWVFVLQWGRR